MSKLSLIALLTCVLAASGCSPVEKQAYQVVVASNAFLKSVKAQHPECNTVTPAATSILCGNLVRATFAKDALIDAVEIYCAGPDFAQGGKCNPPAKSTPGAAQALAKLQAALSQYEQAEKDIKGAIH